MAHLDGSYYIAPTASSGNDRSVLAVTVVVIVVVVVVLSGWTVVPVVAAAAMMVIRIIVIVLHTRVVGGIGATVVDTEMMAVQTALFPTAPTTVCCLGPTPVASVRAA